MYRSILSSCIGIEGQYRPPPEQSDGGQPVQYCASTPQHDDSIDRYILPITTAFPQYILPRTTAFYQFIGRDKIFLGSVCSVNVQTKILNGLKGSRQKSIDLAREMQQER